MKNKVITNNKGFTLVETLLYAALLGILMVGFVSFALSISGLYQKGRSMEEVLYGARQIERVLGYYIKDKALDTIFPVSGQASTSLTLDLTDSQADFYLEDAILMMKIDSSEPVAITSNEIEVSDLEIKNYAFANGIDSININCKISFRKIASLEYRYNYNFNMTLNTRS